MSTGMRSSSPLPTRNPRSVRRARLLIVDDQAINIQILYEILKADYDVHMATSGEQAIAFCQAHLPDLVLLDVVMPDIDGYEVCRELKAHPLTQSIPLIFITAQNNPAEEALGLEMGAVDFISKPVNPAVVRARVQTHLLLKFQSDTLRSLAFIDGLTGIANRRYFDELLHREWRRAQRNASTLAIVLIDIDFFKQYNDTLGHLAGDDCLRQVAETLSETLQRSHDSVARYGGEEFVCVLPETDMDGARAVVQMMHSQIAQLKIRHPASPVHDFLTISSGIAVACFPQNLSPENLVALSDQMLYKAKAAGRNGCQSAML